MTWLCCRCRAAEFIWESEQSDLCVREEAEIYSCFISFVLDSAMNQTLEQHTEEPESETGLDRLADTRLHLASSSNQ